MSKQKELKYADNKKEKDELLTHDEMYKLIYLYFQQPNVLYSHHADSFSKMIDEDVPRLLAGQNKFFENIVDNVLYVNRFEFSDLRVKTAMMDNDSELMYPSDARYNNLTYFMKIEGTCKQMVDVITLNNGHKTTKTVGNETKGHPIIGLPLLLSSKYDNAILRPNMAKAEKECRYEPGNCFIIKGSEKLMVVTERMRDNYIMTFVRHDVSGDIHTAQINSRSHDNVELNPQTVSIKFKKDKSMIFKASILNDIPVFIILRAMGLQSDKDIVDNIVQDPKDIQMINEVMASLKKTKDKSRDESKDKVPVLTQIDAYNYILSKIRPLRKFSETNDKIKLEQKKLHLNNILNTDLLPHVSGTMIDKAYCICMMINKLLQCYLGRIEPDDRDSFINKRIETTGELILQLIKQNFKKMLSECGKYFGPRNTDPANPINIVEQIKSSTIEQAVTQAIMLGWGNKNKKGIAQVVQRLSYLQTTSYLRRINSPTDSTVKLTSPRHVHVTQYGYCDPNESPEGAKIGLVKNLSLMATITNTLYSQIPIIKEFLSKYLIKYGNIPALLRRIYTKVYLNGDLLGIHTENPLELVRKLKEARTYSKFHKHVSICYNFDTNEIRIYCDGGRLIRPLLRVGENNELLLKRKHIEQISLQGKTSGDLISTWNRFMTTHPELVDFIDVEETAYSMIAMYPKDLIAERKIMNKHYKEEMKEQAKLNRFDGFVFRRFTHCEFHPSMMLGIISSNTAWLHCNQSPRNIFQYNYAKQAMSIYISNYRERMDISYVLYYPEMSLVGTKAQHFLNTNKLPSGQNIILAIGCFTGYDQEDALIINESSAQRGLLLAKNLKKHQVELKKNASTSKDDMFAKPNPDNTSGISDSNYDKLNSKGYIPENVEIMSGDTIIGKITPQPMTSADVKPYKDTSEIYKDSLPAMVDKVIDNVTNIEGYPIIKMRVNSLRPIVIGDKFAGRSAQKGVCGLLLKQEDMPCTVPFNQRGEPVDSIIPDAIMNPHAIPSRMTIAHVLEMMIGKVGSILGKRIDGTPFIDMDLTKWCDILEEYGLHRFGIYKMYNGMTGQVFDALIFVGPIYYQRLKHLVFDKYYARARGPKQVLTRQPTEGRVRNGGLRFGEMEQWCMLSHGMAQYLKEVLLDKSDIYSTYVCDICGLFAQRMLNKDVWHCPACPSKSDMSGKNNTRISKIVIPYACKLLFQELIALNIAPRIKPKSTLYNIGMF